MIKDIFIKKNRLHFRKPFQIAYETVKSAEVIILKLINGKDDYGLGSAAPDIKVTEEKINAVKNMLGKKLTASFFQYPLSDWKKYHKQIQKTFKNYPSAQSAVEEAILNLFALEQNISLTEFFGGYRKTCDIIMTIGIKDLKATIDEVKKRSKEGYKIIKLKCGLNLNQDIEKILKLSKILPKDCHLALDANQGYSINEAFELINKIKTCNIKFLEQPIGRKNLEGLKKLSQTSKIPIIADEAVVSFKDAQKIILNDYADGINIKLMKCGGPINFIEIFKLAKEFNKIVMIGCMYESQISITTGAHLALALPVDYVDLDSGNLDFKDDPASGGAIIRNGKIEKIRPLKLKNN